MDPRLRPGGYTLVELLSVLLLAGILASIAAPSLSGALHARRVRATVRQLTTDLAYVRMHAVRTGHPTELVLAWNAGRTCVERYQLRELGAQPRVLREVVVRELLPRGCLHSNNSAQPLRFNSRGLPSRVIARTISARSGPAERSVVISQLGRTRHRD